MKRAICLVFAVLLLVSATGCNQEKLQTYIYEDMTLSLPTDMTNVTEREKATKPEILFAFENETLFLYCIREKKAAISPEEHITLEEYTHTLVSTWGLDSFPHGKREGKDYYYIRFNQPHRDGEKGGVREYLTGVYMNDTAYWFIQMDAWQEDFDEEACYRYLDSVILQ